MAERASGLWITASEASEKDAVWGPAESSDLHLILRLLGFYTDTEKSGSQLELNAEAQFLQVASTCREARRKTDEKVWWNKIWKEMADECL